MKETVACTARKYIVRTMLELFVFGLSLFILAEKYGGTPNVSMYVVIGIFMAAFFAVGFVFFIIFIKKPKVAVSYDAQTSTFEFHVDKKHIRNVSVDEIESVCTKKTRVPVWSYSPGTLLINTKNNETIKITYVDEAEVAVRKINRILSNSAT